MSPGHYPEAAICQLVLQGLALSLLGPVWLAASMLLSFYSDLLLHLPPVPKRPGWSGPEGRQRTHTEIQKSKLWTLCHNVNCDKLMMHLQFLPGLPSQLTAWLLTLSAAGMQRYAAKINSSLPNHLTDFTCRWFYLESAWHDYSITWNYLLRESLDTKANEGSHYITKLIVSP